MRQEVYEEILTCKVGDLPLKYLGIPVDRKKVKNSEWKRIEDKLEHKLSCWQGKLPSIGGRLVLVNSSLTRDTFVYDVPLQAPCEG